MDYRTLFLTYLASLTVYTAFAGLLALRNKNIRGLRWVAAGLLITLFKFGLQGLEGRIPTVFSSLVANELYLVAFILQFLGLRWFVDRTPIRHRWSFVLVGLLATLYAVLYMFRVPYISNLINIPVTYIIGATGWILATRGRNLFHTVSRWSALFVFAQMIVSGYRTILTNLNYAKPWMVIDAQGDPRWIYSLMAMMLLTTCVIMCDFWFLVVELQRELIEQARTDALTGILNRRSLYVEADREIARSLRSGHALSVLLMDVDNFKATNDSLGHAAGDYALQRMVLGIRHILRSEDLFARTGGEEFAILLPNTGSEQARNVAERVRTSLEALDLTYEGTPVRISVSIGVAEMLPSCAELDNLLQRADTAMYVAKRNGKNRTILYDSITAPAPTGAI